MAARPSGDHDATVRFDQGDHLRFDELGVSAGHRVVLQTALAPLGVAPAVLDHHRHHRGHAMLGDQVVEHRRQVPVRAILSHDDGR
jgi:hypothetical protein